MSTRFPFLQNTKRLITINEQYFKNLVPTWENFSEDEKKWIREKKIDELDEALDKNVIDPDWLDKFISIKRIPI